MSTVILEHSFVQILKSMNLPHSEGKIEKIKNDLKNELQLFKQRELPTSAFALIIDSYSKAKLKITQKLNKLLAMPASVSTKKGKKDIFGVYTFFGKKK